MSNIIDSIQLSGVTYTLSAQTGGGGNPTVELTQAEYDSLVTAGTVAEDTYYIITDAEAGDLSNYWTSAQTQSAMTQAISEATSGKVDSSTYTAYTAATDTALSGKQDTLVSGTNIKTINNQSLLGSGNIDIQGGGGGGKAIEAGRGIAITTGETADTVSFNLPISANTNNSVVMGGKIVNSFTNNGKDCLMVGSELTTNNGSDCCLVVGYRNSVNGDGSAVIGWNSKSIGDSAFAFGTQVTANTSYTFAAGRYSIAKNYFETSFGQYNASNTGSTNADKTLFSVGNGTADNARHNAFEIRQNGDIYLSSGGTDIKLQDHLGGGGASYSAGTGIDITNNVISVTGMVDTTTYDTYTAATDTALSNKQTTLTAGTGISIIDNVISATGGGGGMTEDDELLLSTALVDLNERKIDASEVKSQLGNYQKKGDYVTTNTLNTRLAEYETALDEQNVEEVTAYALNDLNERFGGLKIVKITESEYAALTTKDENTLYIVVADPS